MPFRLKDILILPLTWCEHQVQLLAYFQHYWLCHNGSGQGGCQDHRTSAWWDVFICATHPLNHCVHKAKLSITTASKLPLCITHMEKYTWHYRFNVKLSASLQAVHCSLMSMPFRRVMQFTQQSLCRMSVYARFSVEKHYPDSAKHTRYYYNSSRDMCMCACVCMSL